MYLTLVQGLWSFSKYLQCALGLVVGLSSLFSVCMPDFSPGSLVLSQYMCTGLSRGSFVFIQCMSLSHGSLVFSHYIYVYGFTV